MLRELWNAVTSYIAVAGVNALFSGHQDLWPLCPLRPRVRSKIYHIRSRKTTTSYAGLNSREPDHYVIYSEHEVLRFLCLEPLFHITWQCT